MIRARWGRERRVSAACRVTRRIARGDAAEARRRLEGARDAPCGSMIAHSRRDAQAWCRRRLRAAARRHGFQLVDLPQLFGGSGLPDRKLFFLDYCHLTARDCPPR
jgi:hypothetical protein